MHTAVGREVGIECMASWNDVKRRLIAERARLTARIKRIDELLQAVDELQRVMPNIDVPAETAAFFEPAEEEGNGNLDLLGAATTEDVVTNASEASRGGSRERNILPPSDIAAFARETLLATRRPMKRGELVRAMEERGLPLAGGDKAKNLGTILWRHRGDFVSLPSLGYWPRDVRLEGVYDPDTYQDDEVARG